ncbi:MAG TPA: hypothetical protein PKC21_08035 [Oligoflexia bacterium]|nr:hypothetical protein [Oligoflexia bacterium]HMR25287.1 hypothetical protein [Oligoflexia bacterium]
MKNINFLLMGVVMLLLAGTAFAQDTSEFQNLDNELVYDLSAIGTSDVSLYTINEGELVEIDGPRISFDEERLKINEESLVIIDGKNHVHEIKNVFIRTEDIDEVVAAAQARKQKPTGTVAPLPEWMQTIH